LSDDDLRNILKKFLIFRKAGSNIPSRIDKAIECYELCESLLNGSQELDDIRYDIEDLCSAVGCSEDDIEVEDFPRNLIRGCAATLENEATEYKMFRKELKKKLRK